MNNQSNNITASKRWKYKQGNQTPFIITKGLKDNKIDKNKEFWNDNKSNTREIDQNVILTEFYKSSIHNFTFKNTLSEVSQDRIKITQGNIISETNPALKAMIKDKRPYIKKSTSKNPTKLNNLTKPIGMNNCNKIYCATKSSNENVVIKESKEKENCSFFPCSYQQHETNSSNGKISINTIKSIKNKEIYKKKQFLQIKKQNIIENYSFDRFISNQNNFLNKKEKKLALLRKNSCIENETNNTFKPKISTFNREIFDFKEQLNNSQYSDYLENCHIRRIRNETNYKEKIKILSSSDYLCHKYDMRNMNKCRSYEDSSMQSNKSYNNAPKEDRLHKTRSSLMKNRAIRNSNVYSILHNSLHNLSFD